MKIPIVEKCLCLELETAGMVFGCLGIVGGIFIFIFAAVVMVILSVTSCGDLLELVKDEDVRNLFPTISVSDCQVFRAFAVILTLFVLVYSIISIIINIFLLIGIQKREHGKVLPAVIIKAFATFTLIFRGLVSFSIDGILSAAIFGSLMFLIFVILYSLYVKIRNENRTGYENQIF
ncbi:hypothetical protein ACKWTF_004239 [Chironomus riparius]